MECISTNRREQREARAIAANDRRVERLEEDRANLNADIREVYAEAKSAGFDAKTMRQLIRLRKLEPAERQEQEHLLEVYRNAVGV